MTNAEIIKALRLKAVARGLCYVCRCRFPRPGVRTCDECIARRRENGKGAGNPGRRRRAARSSKRRVAKRLLAGLCITCGRVQAVDGMSMCITCLDKCAANVKLVTSRKRGGPPMIRTCSICGLSGHNKRRHERPGVVPLSR
jgi:hypothetical protein